MQDKECEKPLSEALTELCRPSAAWCAERIERLSRIASDWETSGHEPPAACALSHGEYRAVYLAAGHRMPDRDPLFDFLILDGWLQIWVLERRDMNWAIGQIVGKDFPTP